MRDVSPVRGGAFGNLSQQCEKALECLLCLYVDAVLKYYQPGSVVSGGGGNPGSGGSSGSKVADVGRQWIGRSTYVFGGGRNTNDIARGIFDCSSFVRWAFEQVGMYTSQ